LDGFYLSETVYQAALEKANEQAQVLKGGELKKDN
jgi:hypothetical protein